MARQQPERDLHRQVAAFLNLALPTDAVWTTFPAGGGGKVRGGQLKAAGLMAGWPDIQILWRRKPDGMAYTRFVGIELKTKSGRLSDAQVACHARIFAAGGHVIVARSVEQCEEALRALYVPLRATVVSPNVYMPEQAA